MKTLILGLFSAFILSGVAGAQDAQNTSQNQPSTQAAQPAPTPQTAVATVGGQQQTWTGILLDANCQELTSLRPVRNTPNPSQVANSAPASSAAPTPAPGSSSSSAVSTTMGDSPSAAVVTTVQPSAASSGTSASAAAPKAPQSRSQTAQSATRATGAVSSAPLAPNSSPSDSSQPSSAAAATINTPAAPAVSAADPGSGTRSRTIGSTEVIVANQYPNCRPTPATTFYAVQTGNGTVVFLDESSNPQVQRIIPAAPAAIGTPAVSAAPADLQVTITGTTDGQLIRPADVRAGK